MAELSYPSVGGGSVTDANYENLVSSYTPSGLVGAASGAVPLVYADSTGRQVKVRPSRAAIVRGFHWESDGAGIVRAIDPNTSGQSRIDLAVLRLNRTDWTVTFQIVKGTPASTPVAPAVTQQPGPTGVFEIPLANITVANNASTLASTAVLDRGIYISNQNYSGPRASSPAASLNPLLYYAPDVNRLYANMNGSYQIIGETGGLIKIGAVPNWGGVDENVYVRRWNGFVYMQAMLIRAGGDLLANTFTDLFTLPAVYRPLLGDIAGVGFAGGTCVRIYVAYLTGIVSMTQYPNTFRKGALLTIHPMVWAANNV